MLIRYSVENFLSFNKMQSISFAASQGTRHKDHLITVKENKLLRCGVIFGANASGKSNLIKSIDFALKVIINGLEKIDLNNKYFKINKSNYKKPGIFQFDLAIDNELYSYGIAISYENKMILSEWLYTGKNLDICIFNRNLDKNFYTISSDLKLNKDDNQRFTIYCEDYKNSSNNSINKRLFLTDIATRTSKDSLFFKHFINVFHELNKIIILFPDSRYIQLGDVAKNSSLKQLFEKFLLCFDTGIDSVVNQKVEFEKIFNDINDEQLEKIKNDISNKLHHKNNLNVRLNDDVMSLNMDATGRILVSKMLLNHGNNDNLFECSEESDGTQRLFDLIPLFFKENQDQLIIIDEIDRSLHNKLSRRFLELYFQFATNSNSQMLVTTHETSLMDLDLLRQDEIWFIERDNDHSSHLYSLNKFKERYDKSVEKEYLLGKYGAVPVFIQFTNEDK